MHFRYWTANDFSDIQRDILNTHVLIVAVICVISWKQVIIFHVPASNVTYLLHKRNRDEFTEPTITTTTTINMLRYLPSTAVIKRILFSWRYTSINLHSTSATTKILNKLKRTAIIISYTPSRYFYNKPNTQPVVITRFNLLKFN